MINTKKTIIALLLLLVVLAGAWLYYDHVSFDPARLEAELMQQFGGGERAAQVYGLQELDGYKFCAYTIDGKLTGSAMLVKNRLGKYEIDHSRHFGDPKYYFHSYVYCDPTAEPPASYLVVAGLRENEVDQAVCTYLAADGQYHDQEVTVYNDGPCFLGVSRLPDAAPNSYYEAAATVLYYQGIDVTDVIIKSGVS